MKNQLLLLEDVHGTGQSGDIVAVKPGFARNFLLPQKKAVVAEKHLVRLQAKLQEERSKKAASDQKESEAIAKKLEGQEIKTQVKIDAEGHMYGSVTASEIVAFLEDQLKIAIDKRNVVLLKPIKKLGKHTIALKLKEGVDASIDLEISPEITLEEK